ncbi:unnamed protein product, partial [Prorocentrum cordatum]
PGAPPALKRPRLADLAQAASGAEEEAQAASGAQAAGPGVAREAAGSGADGGARANAPAAASAGAQSAAAPLTSQPGGRVASRSVASQAMGSATGAATGSGRAASSGLGGALGRRRPCGFRSVGNSCYVNSLLQALFPLAPAQRMIAATLGALGDEPEEGLFDLLRQGNKLAGTAIAAWRARGALEPELFAGWRNGEQEDAQEFLQLNLLQNDGSELADLCRGVDWPRLSSPDCPASRDATGAEPFAILSLPLAVADGRRASASARAALADYIEAPCPVEVGDWQCPCAGFLAHRASVLKTHRVTCFPEILLLHLVRWDSFGRAAPHPVAADAVLEARGPDSVGIFSLKAAVVRRGATARKGRYCAFAKYNGTWWLCDDDASRVATEAEIAFFGGGQGAAALTKVYLAFYERLDSAAPLPAQGRLVAEASDAAL